MDRTAGYRRSRGAVSMKSILLVIRHGPGDHLGVREMLDMSLVLATFDCPVSVVLQDDGVFWATLPQFAGESQHPLALSGRLQSLPLYDIETVYLHKASLDARQVTPNPECPGVIVDDTTIRHCIANTDCILDA